MRPRDFFPLAFFGALALAFAAAAPARALPAAEAEPAGGEPEVIFFDRVYLKGVPEPIEGTILDQNADGVRFQRKGSPISFPIAQADIDRIVRAQKPERVYEERARRLAKEDAAGHLALARFCLRYGLSTEAEREASAAARAAGADASRHDLAVEAYRVLASVVRARREKAGDGLFAVLDRELSVYESAGAAGALAPDLALAKARLLRDVGARERAQAEIERLLAALPEGKADLEREARLELGELALSTGDAAKAETAFRLQCEKDPSDGRALEGAGIAAFARGDFEAAGAAFERAAALVAARPEPVLFRGISAFHAGDFELAEKSFSRARELGASGPDLAIYESLALSLRGKTKAAALALAQAAPDAPTASAGFALADGFRLEVAGKPDLALARYAAAAEGPAPFAGLAHFARALALKARGDVAGAEEALCAAARAGYDFATVAAEIARARREVGDFATAVRFAGYAAARRPQDPEVLCGLGLSQLGAGRIDEAERAYCAALAVSPDDIGAMLGKARVLYARGRYGEAEKLFRAVLEKDPRNAYALFAVRRLDEARERRLWRDDFRRPDGPELRNRWIEDERFGVEATIRGGRLVFSGRQMGEAMGRTQVVREVEGAKFAELRVRLDLAGAGIRAGIRLAAREGEVVFFREPGGALAYAMRAQGSDKWGEPVRVGEWPVNSGAHDLWFSIAGADRSEIAFGLDHAELARTKCAALGKAAAFSCAIYVQAPLGAAVEIAAEEARVYVARERRVEKTGGF